MVISAYEGTQNLKLREMATITTEGPRTVLIAPFDPSVIRDIEKGINSANLGFTAAPDGNILRINIPALTSDRRDEFIKFVETNPSYEVYSINFERMIIEYVYDYRFGKGAIRGGDPPIVAMKPPVELKHMTKTTCDNELVWDVDGPKYHHMRFCQKGRVNSKSEPTSENSNINDYKPAPEEISNRLKKWETILETL